MSNDQCGAISYSNAALVGNASKPDIPWIWDGVVAEGAITLLSAPEKTGKTTLLSLLLDRRRDGGMLLGRAVQPGRTILCSEEADILWRLRQPPLDFGPGLEYCCPLGGGPSRRKWRRYLDHLAEQLDGEDANRCFNLLVIDTVMSFLPAAQNNPQRLLWALEKLRWVARHSVGVLLLHQACAARSRSRTRGPLAAFADILLDMHAPAARAPVSNPSARDSLAVESMDEAAGSHETESPLAPLEKWAGGEETESPLAPAGRGAGGEGRIERFARRRSFTGVGRYPGTLQSVAAELNAAGTDYVLLSDDAPACGVAPLLETVRQLLARHPEPLTRQEILSHWPAPDPPPRPETLWRALTRGCEAGIFLRSGEGTKGEAHRYALARREEAA